jgi:uncharacterized repeat protein (TIGR01451 family)
MYIAVRLLGKAVGGEMKRRLGHRVIGAVAVAGAVGFLAGCGPEQPWDNALVSTNAAGTGSGNDNSWQPTFSPDGHKVVFQSWATNLGPTGGGAQLYMRDLDTGATSLLSAAADGTAGNGTSGRPFFSKDGRKVVFQSFATNLGPHDSDSTSLGEDIFEKDLTTGAVTLLTPNAAGTDTMSFDGQIESISPDATKVVFSSYSTDLVTQPVHGAGDVYLRDVTAGTTTLISANAAGTADGNSSSGGGTLSPDGTKVAFSSYATDLGPTDTNGTWDVYVRNLTTGTTSLVSANAAGTDSGNKDSFPAGFTPDSKKVLLGSEASNLGPTDTNGTTDVYLRDLTTGTTTLVSANAAGTDSGNGQSSRPLLSPDGRKVAFTSKASNLGPTDTDKCLVHWNPPVHGPCGDVFIRDLTTGATTLVTANGDNTDSGNRTADVEWFTFSPDGTKILFNTYNGDFGMADDNDAGDVYVRDLAARTTTLVSETPSHTDSGNGASQGGWFSPDGGRIVYWSYASDLSPTDDNNNWVDVYIATFHAADLGVTLTATPEPVAAGGDLTYHQHVVNNGPGDADAAVTSLLLPEGTTFANVTTTAGTCDPPSGGDSRLVLCHLGTLAPGETVDITVGAHATAPAGSALVARAAVDSHTADTNTSNDGTSVTSHVVS